MRVIGWIGAFFERNGGLLGAYILICITVWVLFLIVLPQLAMIDFSLRYDLPAAQRGGPDDVWTLENYRYFLFGHSGNPDGWNRIDVMVFVRTIIAAALVTLLNLAICYPVAYYLAQVAQGREARVLAVALIIP